MVTALILALGGGPLVLTAPLLMKRGTSSLREARAAGLRMGFTGVRRDATDA